MHTKHIVLFSITVLGTLEAYSQDLSTCVWNCITPAAEAAGCSFSGSDFNCFCKSIEYRSTALACMEAQCTQEENTAALQVYAGICGVLAPVSPSSGASSVGTSAPATVTVTMSLSGSSLTISAPTDASETQGLDFNSGTSVFLVGLVSMAVGIGMGMGVS
ncbi:hypothetical protein AX16_009055, partial [Volvariella volvacea WC 439]